jgi:hypothetical protein
LIPVMMGPVTNKDAATTLDLADEIAALHET